MNIYEELASLKLHYLSENLDNFVAQASKSKLSPMETLTRMVELEGIEKTQRSTERRLKEARIGRMKNMSDFDWGWPSKINRKKVEELLLCEFIKEKRNVILAGAQGIGKSMIAKNISWNAAVNGYRTLFTTASDLVLDLGSQESTAALQRRLKRYERPDILVIDEMGYLSFDCKSADLLFEIINRRYEKGSIAITTNLAFKDWHKIFPGASCLTALIDRFTHHADIIKIEASSYRVKESAGREKKNG